MKILILAIVVFSLLHLIPVIPPIKSRLQEKLGRAYGAAFGLSATLALLAIILGWRMSAHVPVYQPPEWGFYGNMVFSLVGFLCLGIFIFRGNLRQILRFPLAVGVIFWSTGHLLANGDMASMILFGGLWLYANTYIVAGLIAGVRPSNDIRAGHDMMSLLTGAAFYGVMVQMHVFIIGVPVVQITH